MLDEENNKTESYQDINVIENVADISDKYNHQLLPSTDTNNNRKIRISVRGNAYETYEKTLNHYPDTLLGNERQRQRFYNRQTRQFCFDVSSDVFDAILFFYQSRGILARPAFVKEDEYVEALRLFGIIRGKESRMRAFTTRQKVWKMLNFPHSSKSALYIQYISFVVVMVSAATFCLETAIQREKHALYRTHTVFFVLDCLYVSFFTIEYFLRLFSSPNPLKYTMSFLGMIDMISILPFYIILLLTLYYTRLTKLMLNFVHCLRLVQILRMIKLSRYITGFRIVAQSLKACKEQMFSLGACFVIGIILSSNLIFVFESFSNRTMFDSIPSTMWFSIISMTTVGYGDVYPRTSAGKICATFAILVGTVLLFHLFLPVYLMYFSLFYAKAQQETTKKRKSRGKHPKNKITRQKQFARSSIIAEAEAQQITAVESNIELTVRYRQPSRVFSPTTFLAANAVSPALRRNSNFKSSI